MLIAATAIETSAAPRLALPAMVTTVSFGATTSRLPAARTPLPAPMLIAAPVEGWVFGTNTTWPLLMSSTG